jgi:carbon-monoxide dehydrogenase large subunit
VAERRAGRGGEVDEETGEVTLAALTSCDDIGRIINHAIVEGQIHGGMAQGAGQALWEQVRYEEGSGQLMTGLADGLLRAARRPAAAAARGFDESVPCKTNLLGVKGCGELGTIGAVPGGGALRCSMRSRCRISRCR